MIPTVEMIEAGWKATLGLNKLQVERILVAALAVMPAARASRDDVAAKVQGIFAGTLDVDQDGDIIGTGPASYKIADMVLPSPDLAAENKRLREALDSIIVYGADTLSGRTDGPSDAAWYREAVREMRNRARSAATKEQTP